MEYFRPLWDYLIVPYLPSFLYNNHSSVSAAQTDQCSEFWHKKMTTFFKRADKHGQGYITFDDYIKTAEYFEKSGGLSPAKARHLRRVLAHTWQHCWCPGTACHQITEDEFVSNMKDCVTGHKRDMITMPMPYIFEAIDLDKNGELSVEEYCTFLAGHNIDVTHANAAFVAMDTNKDHVISKEEFLHAAEEFFLSNEEGEENSHWFWGALIE